uniref:Translocation and assembly module TamB C-terminal domain-containing protein n=1 Tax=candidate division WOR-3 bacterium TaxID=2052148 RepID=A0A7C4TC89_UNCW3
MRKKSPLRIIILSIILVVLIIFFSIDWGKFAIGIIQKSAKIKIEYKELKGNIFKGFQLESYKIKISQTDSIYGESARISYRLSLLGLRLPTLFDIILIKPVINIKRKTDVKSGEFSLPKINLALRINIKGGRLIYEDDKIYTLEDISGLLFLDFWGMNFYITTMNLSFVFNIPVRISNHTPQFPIYVTSANLALNIKKNAFELKFLKVKGRGFFCDARGKYWTDKESGILQIEKISFVPGEIDDYFKTKPLLNKGKIELKGEINLPKKKFLPRLHGFAQNIYFFDYFNFETNCFGDTIFLNIFEGKFLEGTLSAQLKGTNLRDFNLELGFKNINLNRMVKIDKPIWLSGNLIYRREFFSGILSSPAVEGFDFDSLKFSGIISRGAVILDSLFIKNSLLVRGMVYPDLRLSVQFNDFSLLRFSSYLPVKGNISGFLNLQAENYNLQEITLNANLRAYELSFYNFVAQEIFFSVDRFIFKKELENLKLNLSALSYKNLLLDSASISIRKGEFSLGMKRKENDLKISGVIKPSGIGLVESLNFNRKDFVIKNTAPIDFDIFNKKMGDFSFLFAGGILNGSFAPLRITLTDGKMEEIGKLFGVYDARGKIGMHLTEDEIEIAGQEIYFLGLGNGNIKMEADYKNDCLFIQNLTITDDKQQTLTASGLFSFKNSEIDIKFENLRPWIFPFLGTFMRNPDCLMSGGIQYSGNLEKFKITGEGKIEQGKFEVPVISAKLDSVSCKVRFLGDRIVFESAEGIVSAVNYNKLPTGKNITGGGVVRLEPKFQVKNLSFDFEFKDAPMQYQNYAYGVGSGSFTLTMKDGLTSYNGIINIQEGIVPIEFGTKFEEAEENAGPDWRMNLKLVGERNIWLRNRDTDIEFGGEVYIIKDQGPISVLGSLETKRGNYYWLNHILKITQGKVNFLPEPKIDPELDFWAELNTRDRDPKTNQEIRIILHCSGRLTEPVLEFFSEPPLYSEQDILTYLNLNITWRELESMKQGEYMGRVLPQSILAWLESDVSRRLRAYTGLDYLRIEAPIFETQEKTKLTVGKYISRNLFITYTYDLTSFSNEFNVEYFIDDRNEILIKRDGTGEYNLQYQYRIRF